jgi:hypothetical protein
MCLADVERVYTAARPTAETVELAAVCGSEARFGRSATLALSRKPRLQGQIDG